MILRHVVTTLALNLGLINLEELEQMVVRQMTPLDLQTLDLIGLIHHTGSGAFRFIPASPMVPIQNRIFKAQARTRERVEPQVNVHYKKLAFSHGYRNCGENAPSFTILPYIYQTWLILSRPQRKKDSRYTLHLPLIFFHLPLYFLLFQFSFYTSHRPFVSFSIFTSITLPFPVVSTLG